MARDKALLTTRDLGLHHEDGEVLDVLDLPQLYTKPSARILLSTLDDLSSLPPSWEATPHSGTPRVLSGTSTPVRRKRKIKSEGVPQYLTKIVASPLAWIEDDAEKEMVWEAASQRLAERSGRTAMGAISRTFVIPLSAECHAEAQGETEAGPPVDADEVLNVTLHEPALTADNLGLKTWASSYLLAKRMTILQDTLPHLPPNAQVLELGAGTGLVGMAAAAILQRTVILTDLPEIVPNLERNVRANSTTIASHAGKAETALLDWSHPTTLTLHGEQTHPPHSFPLILAADPIYSPGHPRLLVQAIAQHLSPSTNARVVVEIPLREGFVGERRDFRDRMEGLGLMVEGEGEEVGFDDWGDGGEEGGAEVRCWWGVWGWR